MRLPNKKSLVVVASLVAVVILTTALYAATELPLLRPEADLKMAQDLSNLSGLSRDEVLKIYDAIDNWDTVRDNIFIYKRILSMTSANSDQYDEVFDNAENYKPGDMLTIYEFIYGNGKDFKRAKEMFKEFEKGTSLPDVISMFQDNKVYKVYRPASEEQVRQWLNKGFLPEDILNADSIAKSKDMAIAKVLGMKDDDVTWAEIGKKLGYKFPSANQQVSIKIKDGKNVTTLTGKDYDSIVKENNKNVQLRDQSKGGEISKELGLTVEQIKEYENQGFTVHDIENAVKLERQSGVKRDKILQERRDGANWEDIIKSHNG